MSRYHSFRPVIIALDIEFNQPSKKIIQIGAVAGCLKSGEVLSEFVQDVNPHEQLDPRIVKLTGINQTDVDTAIDLHQAYQRLLDWVSQYNARRQINPLTWGGSDSETLRAGLGLDEDGWIFGRRHIDAKTVYVAWRHSQALLANGGLARSMRQLNISFEGRKHNARDDARNTWRMYWALLQQIKGSQTKIPESGE